MLDRRTELKFSGGLHRDSEFLNKNGYQGILIGHKNHPEVLGTMGQLPKGAIKLIETEKQAQDLNANEFYCSHSYATYLS